MNIRIELNFSKYAHVYDKNATLQNVMAGELSSFLPQNMPKKILEIGCGTGAFTKYLLDKPVQKIFLNDISEKMIECMKLKMPLPPYSQIIVGNAELLNFQMVDMITANAVFQWFKDPKDSLRRLKSYIRPNGILVFSTFGPSSLTELRGIAGINSPAALFSDNEWHNFIEEAGLILNTSKKNSYTTFFSSTLELLRNLQQMGATPIRMTSLKELRKLIKKYDSNCSSKQGVYANWELLYFSAINKQ